MGRIIVLLLLVAAVYLVWRAFGPQSWKRATLFDAPQEPLIKGPDDDEEFLWELEKRQFKQRRAKEEAQRQEEERIGALKPAIIAPPPPTRPLLRIIIRMTQNRQQVTRIRPGPTPPTRRKTPAGVGKTA